MQIIRFIRKRNQAWNDGGTTTTSQESGHVVGRYLSGRRAEAPGHKAPVCFGNHWRKVLVCSFLGKYLSCLTTRVVGVDSKGRTNLACCFSTHVSVRKTEKAKTRAANSTNSTPTQSASCFGFGMGYKVSALSLEHLICSWKRGLRIAWYFGHQQDHQAHRVLQGRGSSTVAVTDLKSLYL